jgi:hypothetical protein
VVPETEQNAEQHVAHAKDDRNLHFVGVHEDDLVRSNLFAEFCVKYL